MDLLKKTFFYDFLPTRAVEEAAIARGIPCQVTRAVIEIRDVEKQPKIDLNNPWQIRQTITATDIVNGKLTLSHWSTFDHVFRYWSEDTCNRLIGGQKLFVIIFDYTDADMPNRFQSENIFFEVGPNDTYFLGWMDVVRSRAVNPGDEVRLFWDDRTKTFALKLLRRGKMVEID